MSRLTHHAATDHILRLPDGRRLGYAVFGDPFGYPILNCHGGLVSRNDVEPADADARALGVCIISPDRPGVGLSDRKAGHGLLDWAREDLNELLVSLGVDEFAVMGWSAGGQYALATAYALSDRVSRVACIAGCLPLDDASTFAQLSPLDRRLSKLSRRFPPAARGYFGLTRSFARRAPKRFIKMSVQALGADSAEAVAAQGDWLARIMVEGATDAKGAVDDYRAYVKPWGFSPTDVAVPVDIHQGTSDTLVPEQWGRRLADEIPDATLTIYPDEGHIIALTHRREIMQQLLAVH